MEKILVVDDENRNLRLMEALLLPLGYEVILANDGEEALAKVRETTPDLILLDITMPKMDGYEAARRLKEDEKTKEIPIIFTTGRTEIENEVKGFELGGVDYITKPFSIPILCARVKTHLALKRQNEILKENIRLREDIELIMRHDLKTPLNGIINLPDVVIAMGNLSDTQQKYLKMIVQQGYKMLNMINLSLDLYKMEQGIYQFKPVPVDILPVIADIFQENQIYILSKKLTAEIILNGRPVAEEDHFTIPGENLLFYSLLANLIKNAFEASPRKEKITISLTDDTDYNIVIHNLGTVPENIRDTFFEKYSTSGKSTGTGLGTYSAKMIAETQGGRISLNTSEEDGTTIRINLSKSE